MVAEPGSSITSNRDRFRCTVDCTRSKPHHFGMATPSITLHNGSLLVVGSAASAADLKSTSAEGAAACCDLVEVRLDLLEAPSKQPWRHLSSLPILFTARSGKEGGAGDLSAQQRMNLIESVLDDASLIDIEVASIIDMPALLEQLRQRDIPWIASFHDFTQLPNQDVMGHAATIALKAGAAAFKIAAHLSGPEDLARLIAFQKADHGLPVASMGMGPLAPLSRIQCALAGSTLNYGFLHGTATAPGQWSAIKLKRAISESNASPDF